MAHSILWNITNHWKEAGGSICIDLERDVLYIIKWKSKLLICAWDVILFCFFEDPCWGLTQKWVVRGDARADRARDFIGKGRPGGEQEGQGTQNCSASWLVVSEFMEMELVSGLSLANCFAWPVVWLGVLPGGASPGRSEKDSGRLGVGRLVVSLLFWPLLTSPG